MNSDSRPVPIEELLADAGWVRALAGALTSDASEADDVVQQTWLAALRSPPDDRRSARAWLTTVVRNFARKAHRSESRRNAREAAAARPERDDLPRPDELTTRVETQREVARLASELAEPYRTTVLLRYFEGISSAEIARRQGVPAGTVRWRLKVGLDRLRERLDEDHDGDRNSWVALLLPIAGAPDARPPVSVAAALAAAVGGALVVKKIAVVTVLLAVAGAVYVGIALTPYEVDTGPGVTPVADTDPAVHPSDDTTQGPAAPAPTPAEGEALFRLRALETEEGRPIPDARFTLSGAENPVAGASDGTVLLRHALETEEEAVRVKVEAAGYVPKEVRATAIRGRTTDLGTVRLEPATVVTGRVTGPDGDPVANARVRVTKTPGMLDLEASDRVRGPIGVVASGTTDPEGRFSIEEVPHGLVRVWAGAEGMRWSVSEGITVPTAETVTIPLEPLAPSEVITGLVLDPESKPVPGARVRFSIWDGEGKHLKGGTFSAGADGRFRILNGRGVKAEFTAGDWEGRLGEATIADYVPGSGEIVLRLPPARRFAVLSSTAAFQVEVLGRDDRRSLRQYPGKDGRADVVVPTVPFTIRITADGYRDETRGPYTPDGVPAEIRVDLPPLPGIHGRVLAGGQPVAGARVAAHALCDPRWHQEFNGFTVTREPDPRAETTTGPDGTFHLVPKRAERMIVRASSADLAPAEFPAFSYDPERGEKDVVVALTPGGTIVGRIPVADGVDVTGLIVGISRGDAYGRTVRVARDGAYRFEHLMPGPWLVVRREEEILPGAASSFGGGPRKPIPFNCRVEEGGTTTFDLAPPDRPAVILGRMTVDGKAPEGWRASLYRAGGGLASLVTDDLDRSGKFRLRRAEGEYRVIVTKPGRLFEHPMVVVDTEVRGETRLDLAWRTVMLEDAPASAETVQLLHRWVNPDGWLVLTPIPSGGGKVRVAAGGGEIVRFDRLRWSKPREWPVVK